MDNYCRVEEFLAKTFGRGTNSPSQGLTIGTGKDGNNDDRNDGQDFATRTTELLSVLCKTSR